MEWLRTSAQHTTLYTLKSTPGVGVYAADTPRGPVVIKCWRLSTLAHRTYSALRTTRGARQWSGANRLSGLGMLTPRCHALIRGLAGDQTIEVLIMERVMGRTLLDHMARPTLAARAQHRLAESLARQCATMAEAGVFNRDPKPSNLMVVAADSDEAAVSVLDTVAIRPLVRHVSRHVPPLERLVLEPMGVGALPRRPLMARFIRDWIRLTRPAAHQRAARRELWQTLAARVAAHGDPTPTDNPLTMPV